jgi:hypothetical protein
VAPVFADAVLPNLLVFACGQLAAWLYLRTGRFWLGTAATTALWVLLDWWLVARYLFGVPAADQRLPLLLLQLVAVATVVAFGLARLRRRLAGPRRAERFRAGIAFLLANDRTAAIAAFRRLVRCDPWDVAAWIALGDALWRTGDERCARRAWRRAGSVDIGGGYADLLSHRARRERGAAVRESRARAGAKATPRAAAAEPAAATTPGSE